MESQRKNISIVLPVYNAEKHLQKCIESIFAQTFTDFELLILDDGSIDSTPEIIKSFSKKDPRIRMIPLAHAGVANAMNAGMRRAKGKYISRMDADDEMFPGRIEKQFHFLEEHPDTGVVSCLVEHGGDPELQEGYAAHISWINSLQTHETIFLNRFIDSPVCNPSVMFRKELVEKYGGCREGNFPEDYELWLRWMKQGVRFEKITEVLMKWNDPPERLTRNDERYSPEAFAKVKAEYLAEFITENIGDRKLLLCGAGRITRKKSGFLSEKNIFTNGYIDIDPEKIGKNYNGIPVIGLNELEGKEKCFVVSYVGNRGAREEIRKILSGRKFKEGKDFVMAG
ncbi:MAG: glycosyltransferase [Bacteroidetes bacterium]|nr:glycosyltransferase [Bacteroidota bacterium]